MKKTLLLILVTIAFKSQAGLFKKENDKVMPFSLMDKTPIEFIKEYAKFKKYTITSTKLGKLKKKKLNIITYTPILEVELDNYFEQVLEESGLASQQSESIIQITNFRDSKYAPQKIYSSDDFPSTRKRIMVYHKLKYPFGKSMQRTLRPFQSRLGRIYNMSESVIIVSDRGEKIKSVIQILKTMDTKEGYKNYKDSLRAEAKKRSSEEKQKPSKESNKENNKKKSKNNKRIA